MKYSFITKRKKFYNSEAIANVPIEARSTLSFILSIFNLGAYLLNEDEEGEDEKYLEHVVYNIVLQGIYDSILECKSKNITPDYFEIIHIEHVFWFGFRTIHCSSDEDEIRDLGRNFEFICEKQFVKTFENDETNQFICDYLDIEEGELDIMLSGCIRLVESELEFDGFTIRVEDGYYILDGYDGPIFILPKGNTEDEKRHSLYNIFKVLVERIENEE